MIATLLLQRYTMTALRVSKIPTINTPLQKFVNLHMYKSFIDKLTA